MKIVILNGSPRANGNTAAMVEAFARGAKEAGHAIETVCVGTMKINGCRSCGWCRGAGKGACVQQDDMQKIYPIIRDASCSRPIRRMSMTVRWASIAASSATLARQTVASSRPTTRRTSPRRSSTSATNSARG